MKTKHQYDKNGHGITLDQSVKYQITIAGKLSDCLSDWIETMRIEEEIDESGFVITSISAEFDQAALIGFLRKLYYLSYPLISVIPLKSKEKEKNE